MSVVPPPNNYSPGTFNPANWRSNNTGSLTPQTGAEFFITYPQAQNSITLQNTNVNGTINQGAYTLTTGGGVFSPSLTLLNSDLSPQPDIAYSKTFAGIAVQNSNFVVQSKDSNNATSILTGNTTATSNPYKSILRNSATGTNCGFVFQNASNTNLLTLDSSGNLTNAVSNSAYLTNASLSGTYAPIASPAFTGIPTAPTASVGTNTTQLATTAFVLANAGTTPSILNANYLNLGSNTAPTAQGNLNIYNGNGTAIFNLTCGTGGKAKFNSGVNVPAQTTLTDTTELVTYGYTSTNYAPLASPALTGTPTAPTASVGTNTTQLATTAFVATSYAPLASPALTGNPTAPTPTAGDNDTSIATTAFVATSYAPLASPALTGTPTAPTPTAGDNDTSIATTAFVATSYAPLASPALTGNPTAPTPTAGDNDTSIATTAFVATSYAPLASPALTGTPTAPTAAVGTNTTQLATTAFVLANANGSGNFTTPVSINSTSTTTAALTVQSLNNATRTLSVYQNGTGTAIEPAVVIFGNESGSGGSAILALSANASSSTNSASPIVVSGDSVLSYSTDAAMITGGFCITGESTTANGLRFTPTSITASTPITIASGQYSTILSCNPAASQLQINNSLSTPQLTCNNAIISNSATSALALSVVAGNSVVNTSYRIYLNPTAGQFLNQVVATDAVLLYSNNTAANAALSIGTQSSSRPYNGFRLTQNNINAYSPIYLNTYLTGNDVNTPSFTINSLEQQQSVDIQVVNSAVGVQTTPNFKIQSIKGDFSVYSGLPCFQIVSNFNATDTTLSMVDGDVVIQYGDSASNGTATRGLVITTPYNPSGTSTANGFKFTYNNITAYSPITTSYPRLVSSTTATKNYGSYTATATYSTGFNYNVWFDGGNSTTANLYNFNYYTQIPTNILLAPGSTIDQYIPIVNITEYGYLGNNNISNYSLNCNANSLTTTILTLQFTWVVLLTAGQNPSIINFPRPIVLWKII